MLIIVILEYQHQMIIYVKKKKFKNIPVLKGS